jgi:hypothetical protein
MGKLNQYQLDMFSARQLGAGSRGGILPAPDAGAAQFFCTAQ